MQRLRLSTLLIVVNVGLLLLAVAGVATVAASLLQRFADDQSLARVGQAGASAAQEIDRAGDNALIAARLLGERPTLLRLLQAGDTAGMTAFLTQFRQTGKLGACAVFRDGQLVASSGAVLPWETLVAQLKNGDRFLVPQASALPLVVGGRAGISGRAGGQVLVVTLLDQEFANGLSAKLGATVRIATDPASADAQIARRRDDLDVYEATQPLHDTAGAQVGTIVTTLPTTTLELSLRQLTQRLGLLALSVALLAALGSLLLGRWLSRPLRALTGAADRIGRGDLATPIPAAPGGEIGALASTLEEMRWRLQGLTADLRRQQSESQAIITGIVEGVFSVDRERRIRYVNPQAAAMLGLAPAAIIGRFCGDVLNPQGPGGVRPCAEQCPIVHARFRDGAHATEHLLLENGRRRTVVITSAPPSDDRQMQVLRDETELEATRRLRDAVLANISHEFRTPLSAQLASIELLLDQLPALTTEQIGQLILSLQRGTLRLTQLIDNLLESARIESGRYAIRQRPVALDEVVEEALELTRPLLSQRGQRAQVSLPFPLPPIVGDAPLLTQVFVNLLANANKFAPSNSQITIGGAIEEASIRLWVEDQGPGLPAEQADAPIFDQFIRSASDEPEQRGVGLGLWIVRSIVERHHGRIQAARGNEGGTRIVLILPREQELVVER
jgi:signal transduction histidine kinase